MQCRFKRTIMRKADSIPPGGSWQFLNDSARWQRHDSEMADHMNAHFQAYQSGAASSLMVVDAASSSGTNLFNYLVVNCATEVLPPQVLWNLAVLL